jgi:hypothetical protein
MPNTPNMVSRQGLIFTCGDYPDKQFSLTESEADAAIAAFTPVEADYAHHDGPLDGKLGRLKRVWRQGPHLYGEADVPVWLDPLLADTGRRVSLAWDREQKTILKWGWVTTPRVNDAALMSAYSEFQSTQADATEPHDEGDVTMPLVEDLTNLLRRYQPTAPAGDAPQFSGELTTPTTPAPTPAAAPAAAPTTTPAAVTTPAAPTPAAPTPAFAGVDPAAFAAQQQELSALRSERRRDSAKAVIESLVASGRMLPAEATFALESLTDAMASDATTPATFSVGDKKDLSRAQLLLAGWQSRPRSGLLVEAVPSGLLLTEFSSAGSEDDYATPGGAAKAAREYAQRMNKVETHRNGK